MIDFRQSTAVLMLNRDQFTAKDVAVVKQVFTYTMNVLHAAIAVQTERHLKLQTEVGHVFNYSRCCLPVHNAEFGSY